MIFINKNYLMLLGFFMSFFCSAETPVFIITLKDNLFSPSELVVPAGIKMKLVIHNLDDSAEEFDSFDLNREKVIFAGKNATIYIGPLQPGRYEYFGEYNPTTAQGVIVVKENANVN